MNTYLELILYQYQFLFVIFGLAFFYYYTAQKCNSPIVNIEDKSFSKILLHAFPSSIQELPKFGLLRVGLGLILLIRTFWQWYYLLPSDLANPEFMGSIIFITILYLCITVGLFTNLSLGLAMMFYYGQLFMRNGTLSNDVIALFTIMLILCHSYKTFSLDSYLEKKYPAWKYISLNSIFSLPRKSINIQISYGKFLAALGYWCLCLYSAFKHFNSESWMSGEASIYLMTSAYLVGPHDFFRDLLQEPFFFEFFRHAMFVMFPWYFLFLPSFFLKGPVLTFNLVWWFSFLLFSHFVLQLSWLPEVEFLFFLAFVLIPLRYKSEQIEFYYDGKCNLCARAINTIKLLDITRRVRFMSAQASEKKLDRWGVSQETALTFLAGRYKNETYIGFDLYKLLSTKLPVLWITYPLFVLGKVTNIGPVLYQKIADNRHKMFGTCELRVIKKLPMLPFHTFPLSRVFFAASVTTVMMFSLIFMIHPPIFPDKNNPTSYYHNTLFRAADTADVFGITQINVFNKEDLRMSTHWRVLEYCPETTEKCTLVPMERHDGTRMDYFLSDTLFYGDFTVWKRAFLDQPDVCDYGEPEFWQTEVLHELARLYIRQNNLERGKFKLTYYSLPLPDLTSPNWGSHWDKGNEKVVCIKGFSIDKNSNVTDQY